MRLENIIIERECNVNFGDGAMGDGGSLTAQQGVRLWIVDFGRLGDVA